MTLPPSARHPRLSAARPTVARILHAIPAPSAPHNHRALSPKPASPRRANHAIQSAPPTATQTHRAIPTPSAPHNHRAHNPAPSAWTHQARTILAPKSHTPQGGAR